MICNAPMSYNTSKGAFVSLKLHDKIIYFPLKSFSRKTVSFHLFSDLDKVISFLPEREVVFPKSKLIVFNQWKTFSIDWLVFCCPKTRKSENNFARINFPSNKWSLN